MRLRVIRSCTMLEPVSPAGQAPDANLPWPGDELAFRVAGGTDRDHFFGSGRQSVEDINVMLSLVGTSLASYRSILDFGCGCGRIMLWLKDLAETSSLHGVDIDERAIEWAKENLPWATFSVNQPLPPLDYPDETFDLVFNHSVFTHIDEEYQDRWLGELRRVTRPGGHLVLSVHGDTAYRAFAGGVGGVGKEGADLAEALRRNGIAHVSNDSFVGGPFPDFYHSTFHTPWYVHEHWGQFFSVVGYVARRSLGFQDFVLLERTPGPMNGAPVRTEAPSPVAHTSPTGHRPSPARTAVQWARHTRLASPARRLVRRALTKTPEGPSAGDGRLWEALRVQGDRVNRLEADLWEAIRKDRQTDH